MEDPEPKLLGIDEDGGEMGLQTGEVAFGSVYFDGHRERNGLHQNMVEMPQRGRPEQDHLRIDSRR